MKPFIPVLLACGRVELAGRDPVSLQVQRFADGALSTALQRFVIAQHAGQAYYIAARALDFGSVAPGATCPLSVALPGAPGFRGPGMYVASMGQGGEHKAVVVRQHPILTGHFELSILQDSLEGLRHEHHTLAETEQQEHGYELPLFQLGPDDVGTLWQAAEDLADAKVRQTLFKFLTLGGTIGLVAVGCAFGAAAVRASLEPVVVERREAAQAAVASAVKRLEEVAARKPPKALEELDAAVTAVLREGAGSHIVAFRHDKGKTTLEIVVPMSTDYDQLRSLGRLESAKRDDMRVLSTPGAAQKGQ